MSKTESLCKRVFRGGSWRYGPQYARVAASLVTAPGYRSNVLGVRLVEVLDEQD